MALYRATLVLPYLSGLPEDVATNTAWFASTEPDAPGFDMSEITARWKAAVDSMHLGAGPISGANSAWASSLAGSEGHVSILRMVEPTPRDPYVFPCTFTARTSGSNLPSEVSLCGSFRAVNISGVPNARRRGRLYIGPFSSAALNASGVSRPNSSLEAAVERFIEALSTPVLEDGEAITHRVYSSLETSSWPEGAEVNTGWVDNEWDTQRRRGNRSTGRNTFPLPPSP